MTPEAEPSQTNAEATDPFARFVGLVRTWLSDFDLNSELFAEIMQDEELLLQARILAAGVLMYLLSLRSLIPKGFTKGSILALVVDVVVMATALIIIVPTMSEKRSTYYRRKYPVVDQIGEYEEVLSAALGCSGIVCWAM